MLITKLFKRFLVGPSVKQAFAAVDQGDEEKLRRQLDKGVSPDAILSGTREGHHFAYDEFLLTRAIRQQQYDLALLLIDRGANPHARDLVTRNAKELLLSTIDRMGLFKKRDPNHVFYTDHAALHCWVALEWHGMRTAPLKNLPGLVPHFDHWYYRSREIEQWLNDQLLAYDAFQQGRDIAKAVELSLSDAAQLNDLNDVVEAAPRRRRM